VTGDLAAALERVPIWQGRTDLTTTFLGGGLTNTNCLVRAGGEAWVLRLGGKDTELLGIDRRTEAAAARAAADAGLAPGVVHYVEPEGWLVMEYVAGREALPEEMRTPARIAEAAAAMQRFHGLPAIPGAFSPFRVVEAYLALARERGVTSFPDDFDALLAHMRAVERAFEADPYVPAPCHNDLLNANFLIEDGTGRLVILDWEYAGMGDPHFDLANLAAHHAFEDEQDTLLLQAYFGDVTPRRRARHGLMRAMSDFREAMWGMAQIGLSSLDFDYRGYANTYFDRLRAGVADPRAPGWLAAFA
jgi:thiamine kinase-like enzyme